MTCLAWGIAVGTHQSPDMILVHRGHCVQTPPTPILILVLKACAKIETDVVYVTDEKLSYPQNLSAMNWLYLCRCDLKAGLTVTWSSCDLEKAKYRFFFIIIILSSQVLVHLLLRGSKAVQHPTNTWSGQYKFPSTISPYIKVQWDFRGEDWISESLGEGQLQDQGITKFKLAWKNAKRLCKAIKPLFPVSLKAGPFPLFT